MKKTTFIENGKFYKGNLHCHSTRSDGKLEPYEIVEAYKSKGYNFISFTDHNIFWDSEEFNEDNFITIPGSEVNPRMMEGEFRAYHFVIIPDGKKRREIATLPKFQHNEKLETPYFKCNDDIQKFIDNCYNRGYQITFAHPFWSRIEYDEILKLHNFTTVEIYNHCSQITENMGESNVCCDAVLRNGKRIFISAVDDNHNNYPLNSAMNDSFGGFVCVKAEELTWESICEAFSKGSFYSSQGPEIHDFYIENGMINFSCSPCEKIYINGDIRQIKCFIDKEGKDSLTNISVGIDGTEKYVRIECYDSKGRKAYTNPIWLD